MRIVSYFEKKIRNSNLGVDLLDQFPEDQSGFHSVDLQHELSQLISGRMKYLSIEIEM